LPFCTRCGREFPDDVSFCPYCKVPLIRKSRSFIGRTLGGPGGFKPSEIPEYLARKTEAIGITLFGILVMTLGSFIVALTFQNERYVPYIGTVKEPNIIAVGITFFIGLVIAAYGAHLWNKITHIMWTRQALREYGVPSIFVKEVKSQLSLNSDDIHGNEEQTLGDSEALKAYLDMLDQRLVEGKISEATYKALKEKFEAKVKLAQEEKISQREYPFFIPIARGNIRNKDGSIAQYFGKGKLKLNQNEICFIEDENNERIKIKLPDIKSTRVFGVMEPYGIFIDVRGTSNYQFYIDAEQSEMISLLKSLKHKFEAMGFGDKVDLSRLSEPW
jgi:uncharacterized membrane protein YidH (DUF202 family)